jgi:type IV secretion system protein VirB5
MTSSVYADIWSDILDILKNMYGVQDSQLTELQKITGVEKNIHTDLSGNFGYGNLSDKDMSQYNWSNSSWESVMNMSGGSDAFKAAQKKYDSLYKSKEPKDLGKVVTERTKALYKQSKEINRAALAASSYSFTEITEHMQTVKDILAQLEQHPEEKAAVDLNARLTAELCFIQLEMLKQQNMQTQILATTSQASVNGLSDQAEFLKVDEPK